MQRRRTSRRKRDFLLTSNENARRAKHRVRNPYLHAFLRFFWVRKLLALFRRSVLLSVALGLMALFVLFAIFSPYFDLEKIEVPRDNPNISPTAVQAAMEEFYGHNLLFLSHADVRIKLYEEFPEFRAIEIHENWPSTLELEIDVSPPFFTLFNQETANFSVVSEDGVILAENLGQDLPVVKILQHPAPLRSGQQFASAQMLKKIQLAEQLLLSELGMRVQERQLLLRAKELHLIIRQDTALWFDLALPIAPQVQKLLLAADEIKLSSENFEYIDLRIPQQIFWK